MPCRPADFHPRSIELLQGDRITELLTETSRTFALGIVQLPRPLDRVVAVAYLLLRVSDYFEDNEAMEPAEKIRWLEAWARVLRGEERDLADPEAFDDTTPDAKAARAANEILDAFRALPPPERDVVGQHVVDSTLGMARWVRTGPRFHAEADLDDYMFEVAGRVGLLLTDLFALRCAPIRVRRQQMRALGVQFGLGLQTVNVIRGLSSDPDRGWVFVPRAFAPDGRDPASFLERPGDPASLALLDALVDKAHGHLEAARDYVLGIPRSEYRIRIFCLLPLIFAVRTVERSRSNPLVFTSEVKLSRAEVRGIALRTRLLASSDRWVRSITARTG